MEIFLVGGAVRDEWLNLPVKDRDWVVIGATTQEMLNLGYRQVGKDFPVFLHPQTQEEYALGRMERKIAPGHQGFTFDCGPAVTLEEDLSRRDLTINAIAKNNKGDYIDPYHGIKDIENKILRHVSSAFIEDPLRVLRVFRFLARFKHLGFTVASETVELCQQIVDSGELASLTVERVWQECEKALQYKNPEAFFMGLTSINAISIITDQADLSMQVIQEMNQSVAESVDGLLPEQIFALWVGDNRDLYENIRNHLPLPIKYRKWIEYVLYGSEILAQKKLQTVDNIWQLFKKTGSLRAEGDIAGLCKMLNVDEGLQNKIEKMHHNLLAIDVQVIKNQGKQGSALGKAIEDSQKSTISIII